MLNVKHVLAQIVLCNMGLSKQQEQQQQQENTSSTVLPHPSLELVGQSVFCQWLWLISSEAWALILGFPEPGGQ